MQLKEEVVKAINVKDLSFYYFILGASYQNLWKSNKTDVFILESKWDIEEHQIPRILISLTKKGLLKRVQKGLYQVNLI